MPTNQCTLSPRCLHTAAWGTRMREVNTFFKYEMARWVKALAVKLDGLSSVSRTPWWKERANPHKLPSDFHMHAMAPPPKHAEINKCNKTLIMRVEK